MANPDSSAPSTATLTPAVFSILLALADGEKHGYAIMQALAADTEGAARMGPGTLYGTLDRMRHAQLVAETAGKAEPPAHSDRRRYDRITGAGQKALGGELQLLS